MKVFLSLLTDDVYSKRVDLSIALLVVIKVVEILLGENTSNTGDDGEIY